MDFKFGTHTCNTDFEDDIRICKRRFCSNMRARQILNDLEQDRTRSVEIYTSLKTRGWQRRRNFNAVLDWSWHGCTARSVVVRSQMPPPNSLVLVLDILVSCRLVANCCRPNPRIQAQHLPAHLRSHVATVTQITFRSSRCWLVPGRLVNIASIAGLSPNLSDSTARTCR